MEKIDHSGAFGNLKSEKTDSPVDGTGWFLEENAEQQAEKYLIDTGRKIYDFIEKNAGDSVEDFAKRIKSIETKQLFPEIAEGAFKVESRNEKTDEGFRMEGTTINWGEGLTEIESKQIFHHLISGQCTGQLQQFKETKITLGDEGFGLSDVLPQGYRLFAPLKIENENIGNSDCNTKRKLIFVGLPLNTLGGLFHFFHELGHAHVHEMKNSNEIDKIAEAELARDSKTESEYDNMSRAIILEEERFATAFALRELHKLRDVFEINTEEITLLAYHALLSYYKTFDIDHSNSENLKPLVDKIFGPHH